MRLFFSVVGGLFLIGVVPAVIVATWGDDLFPLVLGAEWQPAGRIAAAITPWILMQFAVNPVSRVAQVYQGQELKLVYDVLALISVAGVLGFGAHAEWSLVRTCMVLGWSQAIVYGVYVLLLMRILWKHQLINVMSPKGLSHGG